MGGLSFKEFNPMLGNRKLMQKYKMEHLFT